MKILVIAPARTSSTALTAYLGQTRGNLVNFNERPALDLQLEYNVYKTNNFQNLLPIIKEELQKRLVNIFDKNNDFVIKFAGHHLKGLSNYIKIIDPVRFDEIHLLERKNFLDQSCSRCVAKNELLWINTDDTSIQNRFLSTSAKEKHFDLNLNHIFDTAFDCKEYINFKKYLNERDIPFQQHFYETPVFRSQKVSNLLETGLDYSKIVRNYFFYNQLNDYFYRYFNYETCEARYTEFVESFDDWYKQQIKLKLKNLYSDI